MSRLTLKADNEERAALDVTLVGDNNNKGGASDICFVHARLVGDNTNKGSAKESDDEKIAPIAMDTVRSAGRTVGMESGTGDGERDGAWLQVIIRYNKLIFPIAAM